jgi:hypothetical protein
MPNRLALGPRIWTAPAHERQAPGNVNVVHDGAIGTNECGGADGGWKFDRSDQMQGHSLIAVTALAGLGNEASIRTRTLKQGSSHEIRHNHTPRQGATGSILRLFINDCQLWTEHPNRFTLNPLHDMPGLNI